MKKNIKIFKIFAYAFILLELVGIVTFSILYFNNISNLRESVKPEFVIIGALTIVFVNALILFCA